MPKLSWRILTQCGLGWSSKASFAASFNLDGIVLEGELPRRARRLVTEWIAAHVPELETNWEKARSGYPLDYIRPLE